MHPGIKCVPPAIAWLAAASMALAATYRVDPVSGDDSNDGSQWTVDGSGAGPRLTIQSAIDSAFDDGGGEVWLKKGKYVPASPQTDGAFTGIAVRMRSNVALRGGFDGTESSPDDRSTISLQVHDTWIDGSALSGPGSPAQHLVAMNGTTNTRVEWVLLTGAATTSGSNGAGAFINGAPGPNVFEFTWFALNDASSSSGAGAAGAYVQSSNAAFANCMFAANTAGDRFAGGLYSNSGSVVTLADCVFAANTAWGGGAILTDGSGSGGISACRSVFAGNQTSNRGGALMAGYGGTIDLSNGLVVGNESKGAGGAIYVNEQGAALLTNVTVAGNAAPNCGGAYLTSDGPPPSTFPSRLRARNVIFADNVPFAIRESRADIDIEETSNCLFFANGTADIRDENTTNVTGAAAIGALSDGMVVQGIVDGDPLFAAGPTGTIESVVQHPDIPFYYVLTDNDPVAEPFDQNGGTIIGKFVQPDPASPLMFPIVDATSSTLTFICGPSLLATLDATGNYAIHGFYIADGSAAQDAGADFTVDAPCSQRDLFDRLRPRGNGFDIGAFEVVEPYIPTVTLATDPNPSTPGQAVTLTATVDGDSPVEGTVEFYDGLQLLDFATIDGKGIAQGTAELVVSDFALGDHELEAVYVGGGNNAEAGSDAHVHSVTKAIPALVVATAPNPSVDGADVTVEVTVTGANPTGTVDFYEGENIKGTQALSGGKAELAFPISFVGVHSVSATYSGDANNESSSRIFVEHTVEPPNSTWMIR